MEIIQKRQQEDNNLIYVLLLFRYDLLVRKYSEFCLPCLSPVSLSPRPLYSTIPSLPVQPGCGAAPLAVPQNILPSPPYTLVCVCVHFSLITLLNSISALMPWEASVLSESKKETAPELVCGSVLAYSRSPYLLPNLNSVHS